MVSFVFDPFYYPLSEKLMTKPKQDDQFSEQEAARRRHAVVKHMLAKPPKPHSEMKVGKSKAKSKTSSRDNKGG
jgi:hypothetical protein